MSGRLCVRMMELADGAQGRAKNPQRLGARRLWGLGQPTGPSHLSLWRDRRSHLLLAGAWNGVWAPWGKELNHEGAALWAPSSALVSSPGMGESLLSVVRPGRPGGRRSPRCSSLRMSPARLGGGLLAVRVMVLQRGTKGPQRGERRMVAGVGGREVVGGGPNFGDEIPDTRSDQWN